MEILSSAFLGFSRMFLNGWSMERAVNTFNSHSAGFEPAQSWHAVLGDEEQAGQLRAGMFKHGIKTTHIILCRAGRCTRYKKTFVGRLHQVVTYLGYRVFPNGTVGVSRESIAKRRLNELQRKAQGASDDELCSYRKRWLQSFSVVAG